MTKKDSRGAAPPPAPQPVGKARWALRSAKAAAPSPKAAAPPLASAARTPRAARSAKAAPAKALASAAGPGEQLLETEPSAEGSAPAKVDAPGTRRRTNSIVCVTSLSGLEPSRTATAVAAEPAAAEPAAAEPAAAEPAAAEPAAAEPAAAESAATEPAAAEPAAAEPAAAALVAAATSPRTASSTARTPRKPRSSSSRPAARARKVRTSAAAAGAGAAAAVTDELVECFTQALGGTGDGAGAAAVAAAATVEEDVFGVGAVDHAAVSRALAEQAAEKDVFCRNCSTRYPFGASLWRETFLGQSLLEALDCMQGEGGAALRQTVLAVFESAMTASLGIFGARNIYRILSGNILKIKNMEGCWVIYVSDLAFADKSCVRHLRLVRIVGTERDRLLEEMRRALLRLEAQEATPATAAPTLPEETAAPTPAQAHSAPATQVKSAT